MKANRRHFLWLTAGAGSAMGLAALSPLPKRDAKSKAGPSSIQQSLGLRQASRASWALGSHVKMIALHRDQKTAAVAISAAFEELELVESLMSIYRPDSQLCRLNRTSVLDEPHPYLVDILQAAQTMSLRSDGAFDVTVQPFWEIYSEAKRQGTIPSSKSVAAAREKVNWRQVNVSPEQIRFSSDGMAITLNGIAQGFAADKATAALMQFGVENALVDTGEFGCLGNKHNGDPWTIGVQHPRHNASFISLAKLADRYLATSGDYATSFTPDHRLNHLFDPRTGQPPEEIASASIAANSALQADALSTAVFVLGPQSGMQLVQSTPGADALLILKDGQMLVTDGFPLESRI